MKCRRPTTRHCPAAERLEDKRLPSPVAGLPSVPAVHVHSTHETPADLARWTHQGPTHAHRGQTHVATGNGAGLGVVGGNGSGVSSGGGSGSRWGGSINTPVLTLGPDSGQLTPSFGLVMVESSPLVQGAVYNLALVTVRNGTSQTLTMQSGLSFEVTGTSAAQPFPVGTYLWKPGQVLVLISLTEDTFPPDFTFNLQGTTVEVPADLYYGIQYSPITLPGVLSTIVPTYVVGGRYALITT
jgi:hypothetical protein